MKLIELYSCVGAFLLYVCEVNVSYVSICPAYDRCYLCEPWAVSPWLRHCALTRCLHHLVLCYYWSESPLFRRWRFCCHQPCLHSATIWESNKTRKQCGGKICIFFVLDIIDITWISLNTAFNCVLLKAFQCWGWKDTGHSQRPMNCQLVDKRGKSGCLTCRTKSLVQSAANFGRVHTKRVLKYIKRLLWKQRGNLKWRFIAGHIVEWR